MKEPRFHKGICAGCMAMRVIEHCIEWCSVTKDGKRFQFYCLFDRCTWCGSEWQDYGQQKATDISMQNAFEDGR